MIQSLQEGDLSEFGSGVDTTIGVLKEHQAYAGKTANRKTKPNDAQGENDEESEKNSGRLVQFSELGNGFTCCGKTLEKLSAGVYDIAILDNGLPLYLPKDIISDKWINFHDDKIQEILNEVDKFWNRGEQFKKFGILQRRGYMFYGPQGGGKSVLIKQIIKKIVEDDGIVFICSSPRNLSTGISYFKKIDKHRKICVIMEDIDSIIDTWGEAELLSYLDGEDSNDKILTLSSTNYPEKLPKRIINRPRRFDRVIKIPFPNPKMRSAYFSEKLGIEDKELDKWVKVTDGFSFGALTELVISVHCLDFTLEESAERIRKMLGAKHSSSEYEDAPKMGFGFGQ